MPTIPDRYQTTGEVLRGGMSEVFICKDALLDRKVIVKFIGDPSQLGRVVDEIKALQKLRSKHVVQIYDYFVDSEEPQIGIIEELVAGRSLQEYPPPGTVPSVDEYLFLLYQVASGLADLHEQGVIHRDIKPDNIKLDEGGLIKIFDFGLARFSGVNDNTVGFSGTLVYAAPELLRNHAIAFTNAVDVYAFGVLAWHLSGLGIPRELFMIPPLLNSIPSFASLPFDIPETLVALLNQTTVLNPIERPKISDIAHTIESLLLEGKHKGLLVSKNESLVINSEKPVVRLSLGGTTFIGIRYTGLLFCVTETDGTVLVNNSAVQVGDALPKSCVITLSGVGNTRVFVTFDISNPEVVL
jgi:serine/threonine protein kinase